MLYVLTLSKANNDHLEISSDKLVPLRNDKNSDQISQRGALASPASSNISDPRLYSVKQQELALK